MDATKKFLRISRDGSDGLGLPRTVHDSTCLYTSTADGRFVIDRHPALGHVTVLSACSGHGFKHSAAIG